MARRCIFCGRSDDMSNEHIVAQRFQKLFGDQPIRKVRGSPGGPMREWDGRLFDAKVKLVCQQNCNGGWMREMDDRVEPLLSPMLIGGSRKLTQVDQRIVAAWAYRVALLYQYRRDTHPVGSPDRARLFYQNKEASPDSAIWLAEFGPNAGTGAISGLTSMKRNDGRDFEGVLTTVRAGHLVFQVLEVPGWGRIGVTMPESEQRRSVQIWPTNSGTRVWPPIHRLDNSELLRFAERFTNENAQWPVT